METTQSENPPQGASEATPAPAETSTTSTFQCRQGCDRSFASAPARNMHEIRAHLKPWSTTGNFKKTRTPKYPSETVEYRRQKYKERAEKYHKQGLTSQGKPFKNSAVSLGMRKAFSKKHKANPKASQIARRQREAGLLNGATTTPEQQTDNMGDSARAIIMAAQVLRAVSLGIKL